MKLLRNKTMLKSNFRMSEPKLLVLTLSNRPDHHSPSFSTQSPFNDKQVVWASALLVGKDLHLTREMMR